MIPDTLSFFHRVTFFFGINPLKFNGDQYIFSKLGNSFVIFRLIVIETLFIYLLLSDSSTLVSHFTATSLFVIRVLRFIQRFAWILFTLLSTIHFLMNKNAIKSSMNHLLDCDGFPDAKSAYQKLNVQHNQLFFSILFVYFPTALVIHEIFMVKASLTYNLSVILNCIGFAYLNSLWGTLLLHANLKFSILRIKLKSIHCILKVENSIIVLDLYEKCLIQFRKLCQAHGPHFILNYNIFRIICITNASLAGHILTLTANDVYFGVYIMMSSVVNGSLNFWLTSTINSLQALVRFIKLYYDRILSHKFLQRQV